MLRLQAPWDGEGLKDRERIARIPKLLMIPACFRQEQAGVFSEAKFDLPCCCCYCWYCWLFLWYQNQFFQAFTADSLPVALDFWYHFETAEAPSLVNCKGSQPWGLLRIPALGTAESPSLVDCWGSQLCGLQRLPGLWTTEIPRIVECELLVLRLSSEINIQD